ncbi:unnamed protein product [Protopolystoma xenopodis]|uniref:Uncharacterized protein n=1 Tax=Protopolystoma xenopodis TaxID=117903 RepID=A0A3S4ZWP7_9PLAT|nr:unnamed protein product [Protopolystoma xenopodis]
MVMARLTDDVDYDAGETSEDVPRPWPYSGNDDAYNGLRTRCVPLSLHTNMTKLRRQILLFKGHSSFTANSEVTSGDYTKTKIQYSLHPLTS